MTEQLDFLSGSVRFPGVPDWVFDYVTTDDWQEFEDFRHTPFGGEVASLFLKYTLQMKRRGHSRFGSRAIIERIRWEQALEHGPDEDGFRISNKWRRRLGIWAMTKHRELDGFFQVKNKIEDEQDKGAT